MPGRASSAGAAEAAGAAALDLSSLAAVSEAVAAGAGIPEVVRAAARALDASLVLIDRSSAVLAVAARSPAEERSLMEEAPGVQTHLLRVGDATVGHLRLRPRGEDVPAPLLHLVVTLVGSEVERLRAPERASEAAQAAFLRALLERSVTDRGDILARGAELGIDLAHGGAVVVVRAHHYAPAGQDWRPRALAAIERAARAVAPGALSCPLDDLGALAATLVPAGGTAEIRRAAEAVARELETAMPSFTFAVGHSRVAADPVDLHRAGSEALLAANVAESAKPAGGEAAGTAGVLAFEETGSYRLLLSAMSEDRAELERFYAETVAPLAAYDEQYETDLVQTLETFLDCDGSVAGSAQRLFTHRHTIRYRLERIRELCGLDVGSTDGRERLSLGLKAMRVLGVPAPRGPAREAGAAAGRVPREPKDR